jgi:hypothetical protein
MTDAEISLDMAATVEKLARRFALESDDDEVASDIRKLKEGLVAEANKMHPKFSSEIDALANSLLRSVIIRRHEIGLRSGSNVSRMVH